MVVIACWLQVISYQRSHVMYMVYISDTIAPVMKDHTSYGTTFESPDRCQQLHWERWRGLELKGLNVKTEKLDLVFLVR